MQIEKVEEMTGDMDPKTNFGLICIQTELERWKYLVRGLIRTRLAKVCFTQRSLTKCSPRQIDKHTLHYLSNDELRSKMSETEIAYATRHQQLLHNHYLSSFLGSFPIALQNLNDTAGGISMIGGPDEDTGVFARALGVADRYNGEEGSVAVKVRGRDGDGEVHVERGEIVVVRWADVRAQIEKGEMELV